MTRMPDAVEMDVVAGPGAEGARRATGGPGPVTTSRPPEIRRCQRHGISLERLRRQRSALFDVLVHASDDVPSRPSRRRARPRRCVRASACPGRRSNHRGPGRRRRARWVRPNARRCSTCCTASGSSTSRPPKSMPRRGADLPLCPAQNSRRCSQEGTVNLTGAGQNEGGFLSIKLLGTVKLMDSARGSSRAGRARLDLIRQRSPHPRLGTNAFWATGGKARRHD